MVPTGRTVDPQTSSLTRRMATIVGTYGRSPDSCSRGSDDGDGYLRQVPGPIFPSNGGGHHIRTWYVPVFMSR